VTDFGLARDNRALDAAPLETRGELLWILHGLQADAMAPKGALARMAKRARKQLEALGLRNDDRLVTELGRVMGTPAYMSPEQAKGERGDERSDVWSFGVVFYEMLTGKLPYRPESSFRSFLRKLTRRRRGPAPLGRGVPSEVRRVLFKCLEVEPEDRYESGTSLVAALHQATAQGTAPPTRRALLYALLLAAAAALFAALALVR
jgi:serine/threonine protein kinase